ICAAPLAACGESRAKARGIRRERDRAGFGIRQFASKAGDPAAAQRPSRQPGCFYTPAVRLRRSRIAETIFRRREDAAAWRSQLYFTPSAQARRAAWYS